MSEVPCITGERAISAFTKFGFAVARITGSHYIMKRPGHPYILSIPVHKGKTVKRGTLRALIDAAGITVADFNAALG